MSINWVAEYHTERRVAAHPEAIPCKLCGERPDPENNYGDGYICVCDGGEVLIDRANQTRDECFADWQRVMGRRVTDWRRM